MNASPVVRNDFYNLAKIALALAETDLAYQVRMVASSGEARPKALAKIRATMAALFANCLHELGIEHVLDGRAGAAEMDETKELARSLLAAVREEMAVPS